MSEAILQDVLRMSIPGRLKLVEKIWESIRAQPELLPITDVQKEELDRRLADHEMNPDVGYSLDEVLDSLDD